MGVYITPKRTKRGTRHVVRYRLGGRAYPLVHAGSFPLKREAQLRRDFIAGEIAAGRNPQDALQAMLTVVEPVRAESALEIGERWLTARLDLDESTKDSHRKRLRKFDAWLDGRDVRTLLRADYQEYIGTLAETMKPGSVKKYYNTVQQFTDSLDIEPNPARDRRLTLPKRLKERITPPTNTQFLAMLDSAPKRWTLPFIVEEQGAMHIGEVADLQWGDVDTVESKIRLRPESVKNQQDSRARSIDLPRWLMSALEDTCPLEDRTAERKVFPGLNPESARSAMADACKFAGIPHFSPKSLRHRRITLWAHQPGMTPMELAAKAGHSDPHETYKTYAHLQNPGECSEQDLRARVEVRVLVAEGR